MKTDFFKCFFSDKDCDTIVAGKGTFGTTSENGNQKL